MGSGSTGELDHHIVIVGAGFAGIGVSSGLNRVGLSDYLIVEEGDGFGGTWYWNRYPGVAVDIPSFSYQFSFAKRTDWSRVYAPGEELRRYADDCAERFGLRDKTRFGTRVAAASFDEAHQRWELQTDDGETLTARHVIDATGVLTQPRLPEIDGLETFAGLTIHTARWDPGQSLRDRRVAVIGTGASAVQVIPAVAGEVRRMTVFQRTPIWCLPKLDGPLAYVRQQVDDPELRSKLTPHYAMGCKRPSFHNEYLSTFNRPNVILETDPIDRITPGGIVTKSGAEHEIDVLILATGFKVFDPGNFPKFPVAGRGGVDLERCWQESRYQAYEGVSVPGFPNYFIMFGPYGYNGSSYFNLIETQSRHIIRCLGQGRRQGATTIEVRPEANQRYFAEMLRRRGRQVFWQPSCSLANSYYFDPHGDVPLRPSPTIETMWRSRRFPLADYRFEAVPP